MESGIRAPAKINLTLEVLGRRDDGYHGIRSVMVPLALADELAIVSDERLTLECDDASLEREDNLALRAAQAIARAAGRDVRARIVLHKRIPSQAGLGGGSSDAAAVLSAAMGGAFGALPSLDWLALARELGSDVPFFLVKSPALVEGTGERVTALGLAPPWHVVAVRPPVGTVTAEAYAAIDASERATRPRKDSVSLRCAEALQRADFELVQSLLSNDFHDWAMQRPEIRTAADALARAGAARPLLAGSGSCVFALAQDAATAGAIAATLDLPAGHRVIQTQFARDPAWRAEARA